MNYLSPVNDILQPVLLNTKVIIVGAGPAGAATSIFLSKAGIPHILLDKATFPRDKVCGDACSGKTVFVLKKANPAWLDEIFADTDANLHCHGVKFVAPNGLSLDIPFQPANMPVHHAAGFITPRKIFDNFLFEKTVSPHADTYQDAAIKNISRSEGVVSVTFSQHGRNYVATAPLIIGADGDKGIIRKTFMNNSVSSKAYCVGLRGYYKGVTGFHQKNFIELHFLPELLPGYLWIFPLSNGMSNIGIGMPSDGVRKKKINLRETMLNAVKNNPAISHRFVNAELTDKILGWGLPTCLKQEPISGDNFMLVGDAANLIDPFSGEGIGNALYSGMVAAQAAGELLQTGSYGAALTAEKYDKVLYKKVGDELKIGALLQRLSGYPWLFNVVVKKAGKSPTLNAALTSMFTDLDLQNQIRKPSFYLKILFNK
ncbi:MAG: geranylgeranyl reductase family protein [Ferruginibacter sp.]